MARRFGSTLERVFVRPNISTPLPRVASLPNPAPAYILYVGRLSEEKGLEVLIGAWDDGLPKLIIAGDGDPTYVAKIREIAQARAATIEFLGNVDRPKLGELMAGASLLVVPSMCAENQPMVILEAFSMGLPVLGSRHGGIEELLKPLGTDFAFNPGDITDLRQRIIGLTSNAERLAVGGAAGRREWLARYCPAAGARELHWHYQQVIVQKGRMKG